jgi:ribose/xylose/arabinose/galactoside ABC-type transport system permease subunit
MKRWLVRLGPLLGLLAIYALFAAIGPSSFSTVRTLETMARQTAIVGMLSLGMTLVIVSGGIDLSVGSIVALVTVVIAARLSAGAGPLEAAGEGLLAGLLCGLVNGALIVGLRVVPFIVTLGTLLVVRGAAKGLAGEQKIDAPITWLNDLLSPPLAGWMIFPPGVWALAALSVGLFLWLRYTRTGLHSFAVGANEATARLCGVAVDRVKLLAYVVSGGFAAVAGLLQFSRLTVGDPTVASGIELDAIAAVVIGGGSLAGGEGSVLGSIVGALVMTVIRAGCTQIGLSNWVQEIVTGVIIVVAVAIDRLRGARAAA